MENLKRTELAYKMLCAWSNVSPDKAPPEWWLHPYDVNQKNYRLAWERVAQAAIDHLKAPGNYIEFLDGKMTDNKHNNPPITITIELTLEEAEFMVENCNSNIEQGLHILDGNFSTSLKRKTVDLIEHFRPIRDKVRKALD